MIEHPVHAGVSRRTFLREIAAISLGGTALGACASASRTSTTGAPGRQIGVQLYTVRDRLQQDFEGTLARVAEIGYDKVEFAGYYNRPPEQVRALLDRLGMTAPSTHIGANLLREDLPRQIGIAKTIGHEYITAPSFPINRTTDSTQPWKEAAAEFNRIAATVRAEGIRFAYHNHSWEFRPLEGGRTGFDVLLAETDPDLVDFELDLYWAVHGGRDPIQMFQQHPGRFVMWHVKDMRDAQGEQAMAPVGQGTIPFRSIFARAQQSGMRHFFVEHDNAAETVGSLASIQASYQHLRQLLS